MSFTCGDNRGIRLFIDSEGLLSEKMLACVDYIAIELLMKIMRNCAVNRIHFRIFDYLMIIRFIVFDGIEVFEEPFLSLVRRIAYRDNLRTCNVLGKMAPARGGGSKFSSHKSASDNAETDSFTHIKHLV